MGSTAGTAGTASTAGTAGAEGPGSGEGELKRVIGPRLLLFFVVGDIIGAGIFAVTGDVAAQVGGIAWLPFLVAFAVASLTALSYLELVTAHPQAAGAALFAHKAFGLHFVTFLVAFAVVCSGITSASTSSTLLSSNLLLGLDEVVGGVPTGETATLVTALVVVLLLAAVNLRGVGESVKLNVVLTSGGSSSSSRRARRTSSWPRRWPRRWRSSPWWASRTPSTWSRRPTTRAGPSPAPC
ncbi:amino acid permease [Nocardioides perillae]|uniref:Amino acid transporter n=1 Tax=Nocardioides perillae TaxID=1119534 RepID=A0A7Y9UVB1_9ACTN|nr:amino acid permease [Nocardioides perillae]NYG56265.1 amino acid transporter [Nocardioides perillae]